MDWIEKLDGNVIVCNAESIIIYMNETAIRNYAKDGGADLIGRTLMDCYNADSRRKILEIMTTLHYLYLAGRIKHKAISSNEAFDLFDIKVEGRHTAIGDAIATAKLFTRLLYLIR